jgi:hypothetical protein
MNWVRTDLKVVSPASLAETTGATCNNVNNIMPTIGKARVDQCLPG